MYPKDLTWIARSEDENRESAMSKVIQLVFLRRIDLVGDGMYTPEGYNIKRYGVYTEGTEFISSALTRLLPMWNPR